MTTQSTQAIANTNLNLSYKERTAASATRCCACGKQLVDPFSIDLGMGPVCSKKHYENHVSQSPEMVENALGVLVASNLPEDFKADLRGMTQAPHELSRALLWWASAHLEDEETVLGCANILSELGYITLGDRLRERNTDVIIRRNEDGTYTLSNRSNWETTKMINSIHGTTRTNTGGRFRKGWTFDEKAKSKVWAALSLAYGGMCATVPAKEKEGPTQVVRIPKRTIQEIRTLVYGVINTPKKPSKPKKVNTTKYVQIVGNDVYITTPYDSDFIQALKAFIPYQERSWSRGDKRWIVGRKHLNLALGLVQKHF